MGVDFVVYGVNGVRGVYGVCVVRNGDSYTAFSLRRHCSAAATDICIPTQGRASSKA